MNPVALVSVAVFAGLLIFAVLVGVNSLLTRNEQRPPGMRSSQWFRTWWLRVPEPRELSMVFTALYLIALGTGLVTLLWPPVSLSSELGGPHSMISVGVILVLGSLIAMGAGFREHWKLERVGLWLMSGALVLYASVVLVLHMSNDGSRLTQLGVIFMGLTGFLIRYLMIWRFTYRPRG